MDQLNKIQESDCVLQVNKFEEKEEFDICKYCYMKHERDRKNIQPLDKFVEVAS